MSRKSPRQRLSDERMYFWLHSSFPDGKYHPPERKVPVKEIKKGALYIDGELSRETGWCYYEQDYVLLGTEYFIAKSDIRGEIGYFWHVCSSGKNGEVNKLCRTLSDGKRQPINFPTADSAKDFVNIKILGLPSRYDRQGHKQKAKKRSKERQERAQIHTMRAQYKVAQGAI